MLKKASLLSFLIILNWSLKSQEPDTLAKGIHQIESEYYSDSIKRPYESGEKALSVPSELISSGKSTLTAKVIGWHPYWAASSAYMSYDYNVISHIAYFSYEVDTATGGFTSIHNWNTTPVIDFAHQHGTKVILTVTNFGTSRNTKLLSDSVKQKFLINNLVALLKSRNGDGINFDLESVSNTQRSNLVKFIKRAVTLIKSELPAAEISMATPAVDWSGAWDLKALSELCDYLIMMGYDYYWSGSSTAGPVAPLAGENYNVSRSINTYLTAGVAPGKLLLGVPWYGYDWPVVNSSRKATATGTATARTYSATTQLAQTYNDIFDKTTQVPWLNYSVATGLRQLWFEDSISLSSKYYLVKSQNLAGVGIWALSYEGSHIDVWNTISSAFSLTETSTNVIARIYPNPVVGISNIEFTIAEKQTVTLKIVDLTGKIRIVIINEELEPGSYTKELKSEQLGQGLYLCVLQTKTGISTRKIVIAR